MTENEKELLRIIHSHKDTETALKIVMDVILEFLKQDESSQEPQIVYSPESA